MENIVASNIRRSYNRIRSPFKPIVSVNRNVEIVLTENGINTMNGSLQIFGALEYCLAGTALGIVLFLLLRILRSRMTRWFLHFIFFFPIFISVTYVFFPSASLQNHENSADSVSRLESESAFMNVSAKSNSLYKMVSDTDRAGHYARPLAETKAASQSVRSDDGRNVVKAKTIVPENISTADLTTSNPNSSDTIRSVGFHSQFDETSKQSEASADRQLLQTDSQNDRLSESFSPLETARLATVYIESKVWKKRDNGKPREVSETGSGVIVMTKHGDFYVLTNCHVAGNPVSNDDVNVKLCDGRIVHPTRVASSEEFDLAVLQISKGILPDSLQNEDPVGLTRAFAYHEHDLTWNPATVGDSDNVRIAEPVWAIGSPFGLEGTVTKGIISGLDRHQIPLGTDNQVQGFIQTDASVNPGNSGGPLVNERGEVIGIMIAIASKTGESSGVSFAIPVNNAIHVAEELIKNGTYTHPYMGIHLDRHFDASEKIASGLVLQSSKGGEKAKRAIGARVSKVVAGSPAAKAGLQQGDIIIRFTNKRFKNKPIEDEQQLEYLISLSDISDAPSIDVIRGGNRLSIVLQLTNKNQLTAQRVSAENEL